MGLGIIGLVKSLAPLSLYVVAVFVIFTCLSGRVKYGLFFLVPLFPLQNVLNKIHSFPLGNQINDILMIAMVLGWLFSSVTSQRKVFDKSIFNPLLFATCLYLYFTLWNGVFIFGLPVPFSSIDPRVQAFKNYLYFPVLFWLVFNNLRHKKDLVFLFGAIVVSMLLMDYYTVDQLRWSSGLVSREKISGTFEWTGVNVVAAFYAAYTFIFIAILIYVKNKWFKILLGAIIAMNIYCVLFTFSRGAYVAFFLGSLTYSLVKDRRWIVPILIIGFLWQAVLPAEVTQRIKQTQTEDGQLESSAERRLIMWDQSMQLVQQSPIIGVGYYIFPFLGFELGDTHNLYLKILAEQGIVGLLIFLFIIIFALRRSWRLFRFSTDNFFKALGLGLFLCTISLIVSNIFGDRWNYLQIGTFFWVLLGMVERGIRIAEEENRRGDVRTLGREDMKIEDADENAQEMAPKPKVKMWNVRRGEA